MESIERQIDKMKISVFAKFTNFGIGDFFGVGLNIEGGLLNFSFLKEGTYEKVCLI